MDEITPDNPESETADELSEEEMGGLLERLKKEHRSIDLEIKAMIETGVMDVLKIKRMKKIKLAMKDKITFIENQLTPDIIA